jgi:hypothetical protein
MPRRQHRTVPDDATPLRRLLHHALSAIELVVDEWLAPEADLVLLAAAIKLLRRDVVLAIVLLDEPDRDVPSVLEASRAAGITAALRVNAALGAAYQDRCAPPRTVLAACHAVARLIEALHRPPAATEIARWN